MDAGLLRPPLRMSYGFRSQRWDVILTALFTSGFQTVKAAITKPGKSLRSE